jgi:hypothetical protein
MLGRANINHWTNLFHHNYSYINAWDQNLWMKANRKTCNKVFDSVYTDMMAVVKLRIS